MGMTREQYAAAIPKCCAYQTIEAHEDMLLCWGLAKAVENGAPMNCGECSANTMNPPPCHVCGSKNGFHLRTCSGYLVDPETGEPIPTHNVELTCAARGGLVQRDAAVSASGSAEGYASANNGGRE